MVSTAPYALYTLATKSNSTLSTADKVEGTFDKVVRFLHVVLGTTALLRRIAGTKFVTVPVSPNQQYQSTDGVILSLLPFSNLLIKSVNVSN